MHKLDERKAAKSGVEQALLAQTGSTKGDNQRGRGRGRNSYRGGRGRGNNSNSNCGRGNSSNNNSNEGYRGRGGRGVRGRGGRKSDKSHIQCYNCNKYGHFADECYSNTNNNDVKLAQEEDENEETLLMVVEEKISEETLNMATVTNEGNHDDEWFLDTGCSTHMSGRKDWFIDMDHSIKSRVRFVDDRTMKVEGVGKVKIKRKDGYVCFISGVLYVPGMKSNLLSIGQLLEKGYRMVLEELGMKVYDCENRLLIKAVLSKNRTFKVEFDVVTQQCLATTVNKDEWL